MTDIEQPKGVSRRTVTKAMAWAVPAVAVAASVPVAAASGPIDFDPDNASTTCKSTGAGKGCCPPNFYQFKLVFKNNGAVSYDVSVAANSATAIPNGCPTVTNPEASSITIAPGETETLVVCAGESSCNAQGTMDISFTYTYAPSDGGAPVSVDETAHWASISPCDNAC